MSLFRCGSSNSLKGECTTICSWYSASGGSGYTYTTEKDYKFLLVKTLKCNVTAQYKAMKEIGDYYYYYVGIKKGAKFSVPNFSPSTTNGSLTIYSIE